MFLVAIYEMSLLTLKTEWHQQSSCCQRHYVYVGQVLSAAVWKRWRPLSVTRLMSSAKSSVGETIGNEYLPVRRTSSMQCSFLLSTWYATYLQNGHCFSSTHHPLVISRNQQYNHIQYVFMCVLSSPSLCLY